MKQRKPAQGQALRIALIFSALFACLILISLAFKVGKVIRDSHFDGSHQLNILVKDGKGSDLLYSFSPDTSSISILSAQVSALPKDGEIVNAQLSDSPKNIVLQALLHGTSTLTRLDLLRLFLFTQGVNRNNITITPTLSAAFYDHTLFQEGQTIAIVNATDISGLGNIVAKMLSNMGANVISITSTVAHQKKSTLFYFGNVSYTAHRLSKVLAIPAIQTKEAGVADITIVIGEENKF